jgi:hypothetical protein
MLGFFLVSFLFKTGLWVPLLLIGAFFWFMRGGRHGWGRNWRWGDRNWEWRGWDEKAKRDWTYADAPEADKPKRDHSEYV